MIHSIKIYILLVFILLGIAVLSGILYFTSREYKTVQQERSDAVISPAPQSIANIEAQNKIEILKQENIAEPANTVNLAEQGEAFYLLEEYQNSINAYILALEIDPENAQLYVGLGNSYLQNDEIVKAINAFEKATQLESPGTQPYIKLATIYDNRMPVKEKVIESYTNGIQANPNDTTIRILFASFYEQINEKELALQQYRDILAIDPTNDIALKKVAELQ